MELNSVFRTLEAQSRTIRSSSSTNGVEFVSFISFKIVDVTSLCIDANRDSVGTASRVVLRRAA